jgi:predicted Zn-dependent protease
MGIADVADLLTESEARKLCERILSHSSADGTEVRVDAANGGNARFAVNQITTSADVHDVRATVTARFGSRSAAVTFNAQEDREVAESVARAERLAQIAPEDPELMPLLPATSYATVPAFFDTTAELSATGRTDAVLAVVDTAAPAGFQASGFLQHRARALAIANTAGLFMYHRSTGASLTTTVRAPQGAGSGWAGGSHNDWARVTVPSELAARAVEKARQSVDPVEVAPGNHTVVLEPTAVGNLMQLLTFSLGARAADEGRSFFSRRGGGNKIGQRVVDERVTLVSDPQDPDILERPFTEDGQLVGQTVWIENGVLRHLAYSRYWAEKQGTDPAPLAGGIKMQGAQGTAADLVASVERGLLVTRFWYIRSVDRRALLFTGLTRDGTYLIENGRVTAAVKNLRFNESPIAMLNSLVAIGAPVRVVASESGGLGATVVTPPLLVRNFRFTSVSDAV